MLSQKQKEKVKELNHYLNKEKNGIRYDFFFANEDITILSPEDNKTPIGKINNGEAILRVGYGLVTHNLPIETMYFLRYDNLLRDKYIELVKDEKSKLILAEAFKDTIAKVEIKITTDVLTNIDLYSEFIRVPKEIRENIRKNFNDILDS